MDRARDFRLIPTVKELKVGNGLCKIGSEARIAVSDAAAPLGPIVAEEYQAERDTSVAVKNCEGAGYRFRLVFADAEPGPCAEPEKKPGAYVLQCSESGFSACAADYAGLVHAWQTAKQLLRECSNELQCLTITDEPDLPWRIYHLDLKGTRRTLEDLYTILPILAEFKINAVLAEYEDYIVLEKHPDIAITDAIGKEEWRKWIETAGTYGISVIPLVQTLGHWQYILNKSAYAQLTENTDDPSEGCSSLSGTWELVRDFLDEMLELHPDAPFIHIGLDETAHIGTCPRCQERMGRKGSRHDLYVEWLNRVAEYVISRGGTPMAWGDIVISKMSPDQVSRIRKEIVLVDWGYEETGPLHPILRYKGAYISREWLKRPNSEIADTRMIHFRPGTKFMEDMNPEDMNRLKRHIENPEFPKKIRRSFGTAILTDMGFRTMGVSGIRISAHGGAMPKFITGQLNTISCSNMVRECKGLGMIGSSWARGHSLTTQNAHPDQDWYGIATLGDCGWTELSLSGLRDFDRRFAFQFFGHDDGTIGDLYYLCERTASHVDHVAPDYLDYVADLVSGMLNKTYRHATYLELLLTMVKLRRLRFRGEFALLEIEYFYPIWQKIPSVMRKRIADDIDTVVADIGDRIPELEKCYRRTMIQADARELADTQFLFLRDTLLAAKHKISGEIKR